MRDRMRSRHPMMLFVATVFTYGRQMNHHHHHQRKVLLSCLFPTLQGSANHRYRSRGSKSTFIKSRKYVSKWAWSSFNHGKVFTQASTKTIWASTKATKAFKWLCFDEAINSSYVTFAAYFNKKRALSTLKNCFTVIGNTVTHTRTTTDVTSDFKI